MKNKRKWLGVLVIVLVFGMTVVGCDHNETKAESKNRLKRLSIAGAEGTFIQNNIVSRNVSRSIFDDNLEQYSFSVSSDQEILIEPVYYFDSDDNLISTLIPEDIIPINEN